MVKIVMKEIKIKAVFFFLLDWQRLRFSKSNDKGLEKHMVFGLLMLINEHCSLGYSLIFFF